MLCRRAPMWQAPNRLYRTCCSLRLKHVAVYSKFIRTGTLTSGVLHEVSTGPYIGEADFMGVTGTALTDAI
jgi:hypothetical protein